MHPKSLKLLDDIRQACLYIAEDTTGATLESYLTDRRMRQLVERNFVVIGEALMRLRRIDPGTAEGVTDLQRIIGLRNRLAHGYDEEIDDTLVWRAVQESLPGLQTEVEALRTEEVL